MNVTHRANRRTTTSRIARRATAVVLGLVVMASVVVATPGRAEAHGDGKEDHAPLPYNATAQMKAADADQIAPLGLPSIVGSPSACINGQAAGYPCNNVDLESFVALADMGAADIEEANDVWGWTDAASGREFALVGMTFGTAFVEVTDPQNPVYIGDLHTHGNFGSNWRDLKTHANHAFIVSEATDHGMQVFDLTQLLTVPNPPVTFTETAHYADFGTAHNIVINEDSGFAYAVGSSGVGGCNGGLHMIDISTPTSPQNAGCYADDGYTHDAHCVIYAGPDTTHLGREICMNSNEDTLTVVDVTDKANPVMLSRTTYAGYGYVHQGWLTDDHAYMLIDDELDEILSGLKTTTRIFDVSDLDAPFVVGTHASDNTAIDHNQYVDGGHVYQSNYRAGLRILDITGIASADLSEVASFDVWPEDDAASFNGAWSTYPYFDSGTVLVSAIEHGLFVLRPDLTAPVTDHPPTATVADPIDGAMLGGAFTLDAFAGDDFGVTRVEFSVDGVWVGTDTNGADGWSLDWDSAGVAPGLRTLTATATDGAGQTGAESVSVTIIGTGDVNCDGGLDISDALFISQLEVGIRVDGSCPLANPGGDIYTATGDVNADAAVDIVDALMIAQCTVGIVSPACD